jgi:hypothetical protein
MDLFKVVLPFNIHQHEIFHGLKLAGARFATTSEV